MSSLRVISGTAGGHRLRAVPGDSTRPITDRTKEALFNIIREDLPGGSLLDLFGGTGAVGIEALSRGAAYVRFVDRERAAIKTIHQNLEHTGLAAGAEVMQGDAFAMLRRRPDRPFDYVFVAPPQYKGMWKVALEVLDENPSWLVEDAWVIVQIHPKEYEQLELTHLAEFDQRKYSNTLLMFYERVEEEK